MDWDEARAVSAKAITLGEPLGSLAIAELEALIAALEAEIARIKVEIDAKRRHAAAADAMFR